MNLNAQEITLDPHLNIITIYYSKTGNTKAVAEHIHTTIGGDIFEIKPIRSYPDDYHATTQIAKEEKESNERPGIQSCVNNIQEYDYIFLCYPN
jgi:flavodoxin